jgi:hypothetical protein
MIFKSLSTREVFVMSPKWFTFSCYSLAMVAFAFSLGSCSDGNPTGPASPSVSITSPAQGLSLLEGSNLHLAGSATDPQDGPLPGEALAWTSSIDGALGTGGSIEVASPSVGVHTISLVAMDSDGNRGTASVSVAVEALEFLDGTISDPEIGVVVSSLENAVRLFQLGNPDESRDIALGASSAVTATGVSVWGERAAVPLGNAASVALIDLRSQTIEGFYLFPSGNATGSAFADAETVIVANQETDEVGKFTVGQASSSITERVAVAPNPTEVITVSDSLVLVISSNLDEFWAPRGEGIVSAIDPRTLTLTGTVLTGGTNPQFGGLGPDGLLYVANTGNYIEPSSVAVINPRTMARVDLIEGFTAGSGDVHVDRSGLVYVSGFFFGTLVWNPATESFIRGPDDPVCAPLAGGGCRGATSAFAATDGTLYQTFFGSAAQNLAPWVFQFHAGTFQLADSIASGLGPMGVEIHTFRQN